MKFRLFEIMSEKKVTQQALSENISVSQGNISDWKNGRSFPKVDALIKIADYFDVSVDYLLGRTDVREPAGGSSAPQLSVEEKRLLRLFAELNAEGRDKLLGYADDMIASGKYSPTASRKQQAG